MNRTKHKGSITVEAIIVLGLIAALTPVLYKHVADRRQDIDNINEANTLLLLKEQTKVYIDENKDTLSVGTTLLEPADVGIDIEGYKIGIRKEDDGTINAMIAATDAGSDMKAAKVASLLGVSAGIYSAQDTSKAWVINGVWAENISNYGFSSLPTGVPVVTTAYDEEDTLDLEKIFSAIEDHSFEKLTAKEFCVDNEAVPEDEKCIDKWLFEKCIELIDFCDAGLKCSTAYNKRCNQTCNDILISYRAEGSTPASNYAFRLTGSNPAGESNKTKCYFTSNAGYNAVEVIEACNGENTEACSLANTYGLNTSCQKIMDTYQTLNKTPRNGVYKLGASGINTSCWFKNTTGYSSKEVIEKCNAGTALACQMGSENKLNRTCAEVQTTMKSYGAIPANGSFKLTLTNTSGSSYTCDMNQTPALTEYFYKNAEGTYTFNLLSKKIQYKFELCGASNYGGRAHGGYSWGKKIHNSAQSFFVIVGGVGGTGGVYHGSGGGTEIRFGTASWVDKHRILVGGGSGGYTGAGGLNNSGGGGNNCGQGGSLAGCKGIGGLGSGNAYTPGTIGQGGQSEGVGGNGGGYGGGSGGGVASKVTAGGGGGGGFGGGGQGGDRWGAGASATATNGGGGTTGYNGGIGFNGANGGFGGGGGTDYSSGGGGYGGGGGNGGGGGGRVCLAEMPAGWPACDPAVWVFDEGSGETGSDKCSGTGWVKISVIEIKD
ncbi:MAG: hypothetical protein IKD08_05510 [Alphaproteobacteria bacterium]|nr:hypothetical protein [Alphaproteobacteria bacterium]